MDFLSIISLIGASQGMVLSAVLFTQPSGHKLANKFLALFLLIHSVRLLVSYIIYSGQLQDYPFAVLFMALNFGLGPALYYYVKIMTDSAYHWQNRDIIHFLPTALLVSSVAIFGQSSAYTQQAIAWWDGTEKMPHDQETVALFVLSSFYFLFYLGLTTQRILPHKNKFKAFFSELRRQQLNWIWPVVSLSAVIAISTIIFQLSYLFTDMVPGKQQSLPAITTTLIVYLMAFSSLRQRLIITSAPAAALTQDVLLSPQELPELNNESSETETESRAKYEKTGLKDEARKRLWLTLEDCMQQYHPHTNPDLKLSDLADRLSVSANHLSQTINAESGMKFFDYINQYRVNTAIRLMRKKPDSSLLNIALDSGFRSQQAFSGRFKKTMDTTPSEYRKSL
ncbi:MAG: helix-turn-helix transcriptional regulator [Endozoicomonas sp.]